MHHGQIAKITAFWQIRPPQIYRLPLPCICTGIKIADTSFAMVTKSSNAYSINMQYEVNEPFKWKTRIYHERKTLKRQCSYIFREGQAFAQCPLCPHLKQEPADSPVALTKVPLEEFDCPPRAPLDLELPELELTTVLVLLDLTVVFVDARSLRPPRALPWPLWVGTGSGAGGWTAEASSHLTTQVNVKACLALEKLEKI